MEIYATLCRCKGRLTELQQKLIQRSCSKGVRLLTVSPGWIMTTASTRMMERIAESNKSTVEQAAQSVMDALGGIPYGRPQNLKK